MKKVSKGFELFMKETNGVGEMFMETITKMAQESSLDNKTHELAYISALVTARMYGGLPFHIEQAKECGASTEEIRNAVLVPLPIIGIQVAEALTYIE